MLRRFSTKKLALFGLTCGIVFAGFGLLKSRPASGLPTSGLIAFVPPSGFVEEGEFANTRSWKSADISGATLVAMEDLIENAPAPSANDQEFEKDLLEGQKPIHAILGITDFKIEKLERNSVRDGQKIVLTGTYLNRGNEKIRFEKWQYFYKKGFAQISYSQPDSTKFPSREQIASWLKGYSPFGI